MKRSRAHADCADPVRRVRRPAADWCVNLTNLLLSRNCGADARGGVAQGAGRGTRPAGAAVPRREPGARRVGDGCGPRARAAAMRFLERLVPEAMNATRLSLDWRVLVFSAGIAMTAAFGLAPALRGSRIAPQEGLRDGGRGATGARSHWFQHSLIVFETALAVVLLTCGGLLLQTFQHLRTTDLGMRTEPADLRDAPVPLQGLRPPGRVPRPGGRTGAHDPRRHQCRIDQSDPLHQSGERDVLSAGGAAERPGRRPGGPHPQCEPRLLRHGRGPAA